MASTLARGLAIRKSRMKVHRQDRSIRRTCVAFFLITTREQGSRLSLEENRPFFSSDNRCRVSQKLRGVDSPAIGDEPGTSRFEGDAVKLSLLLYEEN
ncbi:hypothetical protein EVAR_67269_1 [Eumeta japonica]|uniref:Uncharacterized protein n=1 Tax=Eumeta variegata TaxID=151549 RepID=A0A4C1ZNP4_EUMVA|nr:hypothetical protein EVAR_67269_1 [Eumeta japonica]